MTEVKINLANMIIRIQGVYDTLREYCKEYITTEKEIEDFSITVTSEEIQNERESNEYDQKSDNYIEIIYVFLTIFLYLLKCPQSLILSALRAFCFCGKPHISRSIFLYFRYQAWLKSW